MTATNPESGLVRYDYDKEQREGVRASLNLIADALRLLKTKEEAKAWGLRMVCQSAPGPLHQPVAVGHGKEELAPVHTRLCLPPADFCCGTQLQ